MSEKSSFEKHDQEKTMWTKYAWRASQAVMSIFHFGSKKYSWDNWRKARGEDNERMLNAAMRHIVAHMRGEEYDQESGFPHIYHAGCTLMMYIDNWMAERDEQAAKGYGPGAIINFTDGNASTPVVNLAANCPYGFPFDECHGPVYEGSYPGQLIPSCNKCFNDRGRTGVS